jgi:hypothetical protein
LRDRCAGEETDENRYGCETVREGCGAGNSSGHFRLALAGLAGASSVFAGAISVSLDLML